MATHFDATIKDLLVAEAIAGEVTAAAFFSDAVAKEIQILKEDGSGVPTDVGRFYFLNKKADGVITKSDVINGEKIKYVKVTNPATPVPAYSKFTIDNTGLAVGDIVEVIFKTVNFSWGDWTMKTFPYTLTSTSEATIASALAKQVIRNLQEDYYMNNRPQVIHNKAGYKGVYATETAAYAAIGDLTNGDLVWVIANGKPYTYTSAGATTFAGKFPEKTSWTSEIAATTAEYVNAPKYYDVIVGVSGSDYSIYIIDKKLTGTLEKFDNKSAYTSVGVITRDASNMYAIGEWATTFTGAVLNPCDAEQIRNLEYHLDKKIRKFGGVYNWKEFPFTTSVDLSKTYYIIDVVYEEDDNYNNISRPIAGKKEISILRVAVDSSQEAATLLAAINLTKNGAALSLEDLPAISLGDLADVDLETTAPTDGQVLKFEIDDDTWYPSADAVS